MKKASKYKFLAVFTVIAMFTQMMSPLILSFSYSQANATTSGGYSVDLTSPTDLNPTNTFVWTVSGSKPGEGQEISHVDLTFESCIDASDVSSFTSSAGTPKNELTSNNRLKVDSPLDDGDLPFTITLVLNSNYIANGNTNIFVKTGGGSDAGFPYSVGGPSCTPPTTGTINVSKVEVPDTGTNFPITLTNMVGNSVVGTANMASGDSASFSNLVAGTYTLLETVNPTDYNVSINCGGAVNPLPSFMISLTAGQTLNCIITNTSTKGSIEVTKNVNWGNYDPDEQKTFEICIQGPTYPDGDCQTTDYDGGILNFGGLATGDYIVTETDAGLGWNTTITTSPVSVVAGQVATVTVNNEYNPMCGDGVVNGREECDDDNNVDGDGCSANCTLEKPEEPLCTVDGPKWATFVDSAAQGNLNNGLPITDLTRTDPNKALGVNDGQFFSLGFGGKLILKFSGYIVDMPYSDDLTFHEVTNGRSTYPLEKAEVWVSQDGSLWKSLGEVTSQANMTGIASKDLAGSGFDWVKYVKLVDTTNPAIHNSTADGYDVDAVYANMVVCDEPNMTSTVTMCKYDNAQNPLRGWNLALLGEEMDTAMVESNGTVTKSMDLPAGNYVLVGSGTYQYRGGTGLLTDTNFSQRLASDGYTGPYFPWINVNDLASPGYLGIMVNGAPTNWSNYLAGDNVYYLPVNWTGGEMEFQIKDDNYSDNIGDLLVKIYKGYGGTTGDNGCFELDGVGMGDYEVAETLKVGWQSTSGLQEVVVDGASETFNVFNREIPTTGDLTICKYNDLDKDGKIDDGEPMIEWNMAINVRNEREEAITTPDGDCYTLKDLNFGRYEITENEVVDWVNTYPVGTRIQTVELSVEKPTAIVNFLNYKVPVIKVLASKIICESEDDLPNWGDDASGMVTESTAQQFVDNSKERCRFASDWDFEWGLDGVAKSQPDYVGYMGPNWNAFDTKTGPNGEYAEAKIYDLEGKSRLWFREVLQDGYIPFTYYSGAGVGSNESAEFYCNDDHFKYDNHEQINNPQFETTYYCVGFNVLKPASLTVHKFVDNNLDGIKGANDYSYTEGWNMYLYRGDSCDGKGEMASMLPTASDGYVSFTNLVPGNYYVMEDDKKGWIAGESGVCQVVNLAPDENGNMSFGNFELGMIQGRKYEDLNMNGVRDRGEQYMNDWGIKLYDSNWQGYKKMSTGYDSTEAGNVALGQYRFVDLMPGEYFVCENQQTNWTQTGPILGGNRVANMSGESDEGAVCWRVVINKSGQQVMGRSFGNIEYGEIQGYKWIDMNGNGMRDCDPIIRGATTEFVINPICESLKGDWEMFIDENDNQMKDAGEMSVMTNNSDWYGHYRFTELIPGTYSVCEVEDDDWMRAYPTKSNCQEVVVGAGKIVEDVNFGNYEYGKIAGYKWEDMDGNGMWDEGEEGLEDWGIRLCKLENTISDVAAFRALVDDEAEKIAPHFCSETYDTITDENGYYEFDKLEYGFYAVMEENREGWNYTYPNESEMIHEFEDYLVGYSIPVSSGTMYGREQCMPGLVDATSLIDTKCPNFGNFKLGEINGYKWNDLNRNEVWDSTEDGLADWEIKLCALEQLDDSEVPHRCIEGSVLLTKTDENGYYKFSGLPYGVYAVMEENREGWMYSYPKEMIHEFEDYLVGYDVEVTSSLVEDNLNFGNYQLRPDLSIVKSDGGVLFVNPGDTVVYTLSYENKGEFKAENVVIKETVPVNSTFNQASSTAGWVCVPNLLSGSTCSFNLGTLNVGDKGSVLFAITVNALVAPVTIINTAVIGDDGENGEDLDLTNNTSTDTTPVLIPQQQGVEDEKEGEVLGAAGYSLIAGIIFSLLLVFTTGGLKLYSVKKRK